MPLIFEKELKGEYRLLVWKVDENFEQVKTRLNFDSEKEAKYRGIKLDKRKVEWLGRSLLYDFAGINEVKYLNNGKPVLDHGYISISHCDDLVGLILADYPVGLDIQNPLPIISRIHRKFSNSKEIIWVQTQDDQEDLYSLIWSAKEAVFKIYGENIPFADGMRISIEEDRKSGACELKTDDLNEKIDLLFEQYQSYYIVFNRKF